MSILKEISAASDHWPFYMQGVPTIYMHAEPSPALLAVGRGWGHTAADTMDKVDLRKLYGVATVLAMLLIRLANREDRIAGHTSIYEIIERLEKSEMREILEIQKRWHPHGIR